MWMAPGQMTAVALPARVMGNILTCAPGYCLSPYAAGDGKADVTKAILKRGQRAEHDRLQIGGLERAFEPQIPHLVHRLVGACQRPKPGID
jgi:hypothetical protein